MLDLSVDFSPNIWNDWNKIFRLSLVSKRRQNLQPFVSLRSSDVVSCSICDTAMGLWFEVLAFLISLTLLWLRFRDRVICLCSTLVNDRENISNCRIACRSGQPFNFFYFRNEIRYRNSKSKVCWQTLKVTYGTFCVIETKPFSESVLKECIRL